MNLNQLIFNTVESVISELKVHAGSLQKELEFILSYTQDIDTNFTLKAKKRQIRQIEVLQNHFTDILNLTVKESKEMPGLKVRLEACALVHGVCPLEISRFENMETVHAIQAVKDCVNEKYYQVPKGLVHLVDPAAKDEERQLSKDLTKLFKEINLKRKSIAV